MRSVRTFIVRVLLDPAEPKALRGAVQVMPEGNPEPFTDEQSLLAVLHRTDLSGSGPLPAPFALEKGEEDDG